MVFDESKRLPSEYIAVANVNKKFTALVKVFFFFRLYALFNSELSRKKPSAILTWASCHTWRKLDFTSLLFLQTKKKKVFDWKQGPILFFYHLEPWPRFSGVENNHRGLVDVVVFIHYFLAQYDTEKKEIDTLMLSVFFATWSWKLLIKAGGAVEQKSLTFWDTQ